MDAIQTARERLKLLKQLAQSGRNVNSNNAASKKDLFQSLDRCITAIS